VVATGNSISIPDVRTDTRFIHQTVPVQYRSLVVVPIKSQEDVVGTISIASDLANVFTPNDTRLIEALGIEAAIAIENSNLLEMTREDLKEINALYRVSQGLAATLDPDQLIRDVTISCMRILVIIMFRCLLWIPKTETSSFVTQAGKMQPNS